MNWESMLPKSQNEALQLIDVGMVAVMVCFGLAVPLNFVSGWRYYALVGCVLGEMALGFISLTLSLFARRRLERAGFWRKLSFREAFDLHEWRREKAGVAD